jgi:hypothetical protein
MVLIPEISILQLKQYILQSQNLFYNNSNMDQHI